MKIKVPDARYTIGLEWCGQSEPYWIVRFCQDWVDKARTVAEAVDIAQKHHDTQLNGYFKHEHKAVHP